MKIAVITAMSKEYRAVASCFGSAEAVSAGALKLARYYSEKHEFLLVESGMGFCNAAKAAEMLVRDERPDLLISTGFCGGIAPELQDGDVVVAQKIIITDDRGCEEIPVRLSGIGQNFVARQGTEVKRVVGGTFVSTAIIMSKKRLARLVSSQDPNPVAEMESGAIAIIAAENGIPLLAIRTVSDSSSEELCFSLDELCDVEMRCIRPHKVMQTILRKPHIIPQLVRLSFSSSRAATSLTAALSRLFTLL